jgi:hypothetical protein
MGPFFPPGGFLRQVGPFLFEINVSKSGFGVLSPGETIEMDHTTADCSGTRYYVGSDSTDNFIKRGNTEGTQFIYAAEPPQLLTINSYEDAPLPLDPNHKGTCHRLNPEIRPESLTAIFDLSTLGFTPPFHLEF